MEFKDIKKIHQGKFIARYDLTYVTTDNVEKVYEMISRNRNLEKFEDLSSHGADAVVMIMHSMDGEKILLNREFRLPAGAWVYNFPAGLIEPGESVEEAAARELKEETGLAIGEITDILGESFSAIGFSNEKNVCIVGKAYGNFEKSTSTFEEIQAAWYNKEEVASLLDSEYFAGRTQAYCYLWSHQN